VLKEFKSELVIVTPKQMGDMNKANLQSLQPMLTGDSCFFGQALAGLCGSMGIEHPGLSYLHSIESILHCVSIGMGYSVLPHCLLKGHPLRVEIGVHAFKGKKDFSYFKVCLPGRKETKLVKEMAKYL